MKISIIGTGIYGLAIATLCASNNHEVTMWTENPTLAESFAKNHNLKPLSDILIPNNINVTNNLELALNSSNLVILATSAKYFRSTCKNMAPYLNKDIPICIASKGIENNTCSFLSDIVKETLKSKHISIISGPTFAIDILNKTPCALSLAANTKKASLTTTKALKTNYVKLRVNKGLYGTQICGSIKNVIAISSGILDGLGYSESTRAFLLTESLHDIKELLEKLECNPKTILSFAGIGDLILTASSPKSRNYSYGILLGKRASKQELEDYLNNNTTEGYYTLKSIKELTKNRKIKMPIINIIYDIALNNKNPEILPEFLLNKN